MEEGFDVFSLLRIFLKRWYILVTIPLLLGGAFYYYSLSVYVPYYRTSSTLMVMRPGSAGDNIASSGDIYLSRTLVATYREIALSRRILKVVAEEEMIPYSVEHLRGTITVEGVGDTELITITAGDLDPVMASYLANTVSRLFVEEIDKVISGARVNILDEAPVPRGPANRPSGRVPQFAVIGLIIAAGLAFLIEYLDQSIRDPEVAERLLNLPVLGFIAKSEGRGKLMVLSSTSHAEAFRTMRTNIQFASADKPIKKILVTGATPHCGKSTISSNMAVTFAQGGSRVLLVDADMRRPVQHKIFNKKSEPGLSNLVYNKELDPAVVVQESGKRNLSLILSGPIPPYPSEMLASRRMKELISALEKYFDYIIFDSPPVLVVTDAVVLSTLVDGTLLVLNYGKVKKAEAADTLKQLQMVKANVIGTILNGVPQSRASYGGHNYYYGADEQKEARGIRGALTKKKGVHWLGKK